MQAGCNSEIQIKNNSVVGCGMEYLCSKETSVVEICKQGKNLSNFTKCGGFLQYFGSYKLLKNIMIFEVRTFIDPYLRAAQLTRRNSWRFLAEQFADIFRKQDCIVFMLHFTKLIRKCHCNDCKMYELTRDKHKHRLGWQETLGQPKIFDSLYFIWQA